MLFEITENFHIDFTEVSLISFTDAGVVINFKKTQPLHITCLEKSKSLKEYMIANKLFMQKIHDELSRYDNKVKEEK